MFECKHENLSFVYETIFLLIIEYLLNDRDSETQFNREKE